jgi:Flp pilus assembly pilin Flp
MTSQRALGFLVGLIALVVVIYGVYVMSRG